MSGLRHAFKEWAVVCRALADGRQTLLLRKGGIAEEGGVFRVAHKRFWLYPTYVHQQRSGITEEAAALLERAEAERPPAGAVRLTRFAEVVGVYHCHDIVGPLRLTGLHVWSMETVRSRFAYRTPGLFVLAVRVFAAPAAVELPETPEYAGCKSWVDLGRELPTEGATPVLDDDEFRRRIIEVERLLEPTALA
jgi:hypothetical protein